jgi:hypothetical protein
MKEIPPLLLFGFTAELLVPTRLFGSFLGYIKACGVINMHSRQQAVSHAHTQDKGNVRTQDTITWTTRMVRTEGTEERPGVHKGAFVSLTVPGNSQLHSGLTIMPAQNNTLHD